MDAPYLKPQDIENAAANLLYRFGAYSEPVATPPVAVDEICEKLLKLDIVPGDFDKDFPELELTGAIGALDIEDQVIYVDESNNQTEGRFRFTVAHEIGHHQLHRPILQANRQQQELFVESDIQDVIVCRRENASCPIEWQANRFAAALVMPKQLLIPFLNRLRAKSGISSFQPIAADGSVDVDEVVSYITTWFNVSKVAARIRLQDLSIIPKTRIQVA